MCLATIVRAIAAISAVTALAACATEIRWTRPGASAEEIARAEQECTRDTPVEFHGYASEIKTYMLPMVDPDCMRSKGYYADPNR